jgi:hypothetical protein
VPPGSLLLASGALEGALGPYDTDGLSWTWRSPDPRLDLVQSEIAAIAVQAAADEWPAGRAYEAVRTAAAAALSGADHDVTPAPAVTDERLRSSMAPDDRPRLTESWFCCAEPTDAQFEALRVDTAPTGRGS